MKVIDQEVLAGILQWLHQGETAWLCTIVAAVGSSPRPVGSLLAVNARGEQFGSLSGGCIEEDLLARIASHSLPEVPVQLIEYGITAQENERLGLPCGGRLQVLVQALVIARDEPWIAATLAAIEARTCVRRLVNLHSGATGIEPTPWFLELEYSDERLCQSFGPRLRMLLVGAGQLSQSLAELALAMDYEVLVTDPRELARAQWSGPEVPLLAGMPDDVVRQYASDQHSIVITLTHDPRIDDMALMEALTTQAWYVGALGSQRTTEQRRLRLRELDLSAEQVSALHAPVGLDIGSKTPLEIAVAIMAQLTQLRRSELRR